MQVRQRPKKRRIRFNLQKAMFVLPNLFTVSSIFCGLYSMILCAESTQPENLYRAALSIFFAIFFDMFDGRVARLTKTQSEFGVQLDSMADAISFGAAPALLLYRWAMSDFGTVGLAICFVYVSCGTIRLARFNVIAAREPGLSKYFMGIPIPLAAGTIVALVMANFPYQTPILGGRLGPPIVTVFLSLLMVSNVRYRSFKDLRFTAPSLLLILLLLGVFAVVSSQFKPSTALAALFLGYITFGLVEDTIFFKKRRTQVFENLPDEEREPAESDEEFQDNEDEDESVEGEGLPRTSS